MRTTSMAAVLAVLAAWWVLPAAAFTPDMDGVYSVMDFGAVGDGVTDNTAAFQDAMDTAGKEGGGIVLVPRGKFLIKGHLNIPEQVTLEGIWRAPHRGVPNDAGSTLLAVEGKGDEDGTPFITMRGSSTLKGISIFYPEQENIAQPHAYPWTIRGIGDNISILDCMLLNPWRAVDFGSGYAGRHLVRGLYGQPLKVGIWVNRIFDVGRLEDIHFWPFWSGPNREEPAAQFTKHHGTAFILEKTDGEMLVNVFCILYKVGLLFQPGVTGVSGDGSPSYEEGSAMVTNSYFDECLTAIQINGVQATSGVSFVNCHIMSTVRVAPENQGEVKFTGCGFWAIPELVHHGDLEGQGTVFFESCHFSNWDRAGRGAAAIRANCRRLIVTGCEFVTTRPDHKKIELGTNVRAAVITSNIVQGGLLIDNNAPSNASIVIANNAEEPEGSFLDEWLVIGPFPNPRSSRGDGERQRLGLAEDYLTPVGGESAAKLTRDTAVTFAKDGKEHTVKAVVAKTDPQHTVSLKALYPAMNEVAYAYTQFRVKEAGKGTLSVISNDGSRVWVNGQEVFEWYSDRGGPPNPVPVSVDLKEGINAVLIKVEDAGGSGWSFKIEATDAAGNPVETVLPE